MQSVLFATYTSLGTGTSKTTLNGGNVITLPKGTRQIIGIEPVVVPKTPTAAESTTAKVTLESGDLALYNCDFMAQPVLGILGATGQMHVPKPKFWPLYVPTVGGERITVSGTALVANTVAPKMGCDIYISDEPPRFPQRKGKLGTTTSTGTAAVEVVSDQSLVVNGGSILESVYGAIGYTTVVASDPVQAFINVSSSDVLPAFPIQGVMQPVGAGLSTLISPTSEGIVELDVQLAMAQSCSFRLAADFSAEALGTAGNFVIGLVYV